MADNCIFNVKSFRIEYFHELTDALPDVKSFLYQYFTVIYRNDVGVGHIQIMHYLTLLRQSQATKYR